MSGAHLTSRRSPHAVPPRLPERPERQERQERQEWLEVVTHRFRCGSYWGVALLAASLLATPLRETGDLFAVFYFGAGPWLIRQLSSTAIPARRVCHAECLVTPGMAVLTGLPLVCVLTVAGLMVVGLTARDGPRAATSTVMLAVAGILAGVVLGTLPEVVLGTGSIRSLALTDPRGLGLGAPCLMLVVGFCVPVAGLAYLATGRMERANAVLRSRADGLDATAGVLAAYLPDTLRRRVFAQEFEPALARRWVTVCFVDLAGFTALADRCAPESVIELLHEFSAAVLRVTQEQGGVLDKMLGDGALLFFVADRAELRGSRAEACVAMLEDILPAIAALEQRWRSRGVGETLSVRCGMASGYCSIGDIGDDTRRHYTVIGGPVNLASRLQQRAGLRSVLMDGATASLLRDDRLRALGSQRVDGLSEPVMLFSYRLDGFVDGVAAAEADCCDASEGPPGSAKVPRAWRQPTEKTEPT